MRRLLSGAGLLLFCGSLLAEMAPFSWQKLQQPLNGPAQSIGAFANGCIVGAQQLPLQSDYYQVMRQDQRRYYGHPNLILFIKRLSRQASAYRLGEVLIGDVAMAAGGRFSSGHISHQTGLDVDIQLTLPKQRWNKQMLLKADPLDLVSDDGRSVNNNWRPEIASLIKLAAEDEEVTRLFVAPAIKKKLCSVAGNDRGWLRKVRPWYGHRAHMHVRLRCPPGSPECQDQSLPPEGDGCGVELKSWLAAPHPGSGGPPPAPPLPLHPSCRALFDHLSVQH